MIFFTTTGTATAPTLITKATDISGTTAYLWGNVTSDGGVKIIVRGICWSTSSGPTVTLTTKTTDDNVYNLDYTGVFTSHITGLTPLTTYYVRAYATNSAGTSYGNEISFTTLADYTGQTGTINDIDGNTYQTIGIDNQIWMAENLKTTRYNDGTPIPKITDNTVWVALTTGAYSDYNNSPDNSTIYGRLYNWYTVDNNEATKMASNGGKNVCPTGWHVPSDGEWQALTTYLGGKDVAGGKLKETGTTHWTNPNTGATNETGFTALPGGSCYDIYKDIEINGYWWSSTTYTNPTNAGFRYMSYNNVSVNQASSYGAYKKVGFSVRCVRD